MSREIVLDTETTGLSPREGHRIVEIGCVELLNRVPTGKVFHTYLNPEREMPPDAERVHGLSGAFLADKPLFAAVAKEFLAFVASDPVVAHNAPFDFSFINHELKTAGAETIGPERIIDTLALARRKHPGAQNSLDALCGRYGIDNGRRTKHGALLDAELLAEVYCELTGGRQTGLSLVTAPAAEAKTSVTAAATARQPPPAQGVSRAEQLAHADFVTSLGKQAFWRDYIKA